MRKNLKIGTALLAAALVLGAVTGCSDGASDSATTAANSGSAASDSQDPADGTSAADSGDTAADVQAVIDAGVLKVGVKTDVPNFSLLNTETNEYEGYEVDLAYEMAGAIFGCTADEAKEQDLVEFTGVTAKTRGPLIENGELDMVIATFTINEERKELYNFTTPYYVDAVGLMVLNDSGINSINDLDGKVIGVAQGSNSEDSFKTYVAEEGIDVEPIFETFEGYPALATALASGNIDVFSVDRAILSGYKDDTNKILDDRYAEQEYGAVTSLEDEGLTALAEEVVTGLIDSGKLDEMQTEWGIK
ncbi:MAG TPA: transporter substrate-binding domain-containing protein [Candidatus Enterocloster faecavium]|uniref:Transporter substrate-binding domain-containing protein n=1 Tax=Candidatus Enterocloster faecavium TaxID=2838560 RepID=A0A9D2L5T7_9FIRM|nr:transporter substrate-binding domain-containing protein [Candidatus Enterocloster faecavium]